MAGMTTPEQIRAARALLDWTQGQLAAACGLSVTSLNDIERRKAKPRTKTQERIRRALEAAGVQFTEHGVELPPPAASGPHSTPASRDGAEVVELADAAGKPEAALVRGRRAKA
jgi:transcriptional regulator with XRE-family HTH domain